MAEHLSIELAREGLTVFALYPDGSTLVTADEGILEVVIDSLQDALGYVEQLHASVQKRVAA